MGKIDTRNREYVRIQMELVHMLRERISWFNRIEIANAMAATRHANIQHIKEMEHLFPAESTAGSTVRADQDSVADKQEES